MAIQNVPAAVFASALFKSDFQTAIAALAFGIGTDPDCSTYFSSSAIGAKGGSGLNAMQYSSPEADRLLAEGAAELDKAKRIAIYQKLQARIRDDLPLLPQQQNSNVEGCKLGLSGPQPNINVRSNLWNIEKWRWD